jgi:hypothetical protein
MDRHNHYEAAFADFLREHRVCHVAVDESRRSFLGEELVKSVDFIVTSEGGKWVIDVKGRRYPGGPANHPRRVWENWTTRADVQCSQQWAKRFGEDFQALFVFAYLLTSAEVSPKEEDTYWVWHGSGYLLRAIPVAVYAQQMRQRSPKWDTVCIPQAKFLALSQPLSVYLPEVAVEMVEW